MQIKIHDGKPVITDFSGFDAYRMALAVEKQGISFYEKVLACTHDEKAQSMLKFLIEEERKHLSFFENALTELRQKEPDPGEDNDLLGSMDFGIYEPYNQMKEMCEVISDVGRALNLGVIIEDKSIAFYRACAEHVIADTRKELDEIISQEEKHKELLVNILKIEKGV